MSDLTVIAKNQRGRKTPLFYLGARHVRRLGAQAEAVGVDLCQWMFVILQAGRRHMADFVSPGDTMTTSLKPPKGAGEIALREDQLERLVGSMWSHPALSGVSLWVGVVLCNAARSHETVEMARSLAGQGRPPFKVARSLLDL